MKWIIALYCLRQGAKITRPNWEPEHYWKISKDGYERILCHDGTNANVHLEQLEADDWVIWEETESFSMKKSRDFEKDILNVLIKHRLATKKNLLTSVVIEIEAGNLPIIKIGEKVC